MAPNVLAFAHGQNDWRVRTTAVARWGVKFMTFMAVAMAIDARSLQGSDNLPLGLVYFAIQTVLELFRVAELPLDLSDAWAALPAERRRGILPLGRLEP